MEFPSNLDRNNISMSYTKTHNMIRWKSGKRVDPRLLTLLESFGDIYVRRHEFFRKIFHGEHEELFQKIGVALEKKKQMKKSESLSRSLSMKARGGVLVDEVECMKLERFKVRTPNVIVAGSDDALGDQTQTTTGSNASKKK